MSAPASRRENDTAAEKAVDAIVHILGLACVGYVLSHLFGEIGPGATSGQRVALLVYSFGLIGMLAASALYNLSPAGPWKGVLRRCDRAMIFVMIAGSYTPFAVSAFPPRIGMWLCIAVWIMAALGISLSLAWPRLPNRISIAMYLGMGWLLLLVLPPLMATVSATVLILLLGGGVIYSLGVIVHTRIRVAFHNAAWHAMVVTAAALHLVAVALVLP